MEKEFREIVESILAKTQEDQIPWKKSFGVNAFQFSVEDFSFVIKMLPYVDDITDYECQCYELDIINSNGEIIEVVKPEDHKDELQGVLEKLYVLARRKVLVSKETIEALRKLFLKK